MPVDYSMTAASPGSKDAYIFQWSAVPNADTGTPLPFSKYADRSVQVSGTFGAGGTVVLQGSNNGTTYATLTDPQGNALSFTAAGLEQITEIVRFIRPSVTAGDGTTSLTVTIAARA